jgi:hypothetical protein
MRRRAYFGWFLLHFFLLLAVSCHETVWILAHSATVFPTWTKAYWSRIERITAVPAGDGSANSNPVRQGLNAYVYAAGIEAGYGFFAPAVPNSYKLLFELRYADGRIEYELPRVSGQATGMRLVTLLDYIGRIHYEPLRELLLKTLAYSEYQTHPDVTVIRAIFGYIDEPSAADARRGNDESYRFLHAYDFTFPTSSSRRESE